MLPFYPEPVRTTSGAPYDFVTLLSALVSSKQVKKMCQLHSKVIRSARTWLFYAVCAIKWIKEPFLTTEDKKFWAQLKKSYKAKEKDLEDFTNEVKTDLLPGTPCVLIFSPLPPLSSPPHPPPHPTGSVSYSALLVRSVVRVSCVSCVSRVVFFCCEQH